MEKEALRFLEDLVDAPSPSGFEAQVQEIVRKRMEAFTQDVETDVHGNVIGRLNRGAPFRVMLAGHCDEIGFLVQYVSDEGFLYVQPVGGVDLALMPGRRVYVHARKGRILGVVGKKPIHLMTPEEKKKVPKAHELWVDIGARDKKDARKRVETGDVVTVAEGLAMLGKDIAVSRAFDDKIGAFIVTEVLGRLSKRKGFKNVEVAAVSTVQEEIGLRGARTSAFGIDPHVGVAVDVGFASDQPGTEKKIVGDIKLGAGPILHKGPNINPAVGRLLAGVAERKKIPYQMKAEPRATGTDANVIQINRAGVAAGLVGVPNRYMHTPVEMISLKDAQNAILLLAEFVCALKPGMDFTPRV